MPSGKVVHVLSGKPYDVYVGRCNNRYGLAESEWSNPYKIGRCGTREEVLRKFEADITTDISWYGTRDKDLRFQYRLSMLRGKTLACWCAPKNGYLTTDDETVCHAQILLRLAEELS